MNLSPLLHLKASNQRPQRCIMPDGFTFDVFLSHSSRDKEIVRPLAERLRNDGLRV